MQQQLLYTDIVPKPLTFVNTSDIIIYIKGGNIYDF